MKYWDQRKNLHGGKKKNLVPNFMGVDVMFAISDSVKGLHSTTKIIQKLQRFIQIEITMRNFTRILDIVLPNSYWSVTATTMLLRTLRNTIQRH